MNKKTKLQEFRENLRDSFEYRRSLILIESFDHHSVEEAIERVREEVQFALEIEEWTPGRGHGCFQSSNLTETDLSVVIQLVADEECPKLLILKDALSLLGQDPKAASLLKSFVFENEQREEDDRRMVLLIDTHHDCPKGMERLFHRMDFPYPDKEDIEEHIKEGVQKGLYKIHRRTLAEDEPFQKLLNSLVGMQLYEIQNLIKFQMYKMSKTNPIISEIKSDSYKIFAEQKKQIVKNTGVLEVVDANISLDSVCGLENLKTYLSRKKKILQEDVKREKYKIPAPKGILLVGSPGCGKTMAAKAIAVEFDIPLLRLDVGRLMGMYVGQSEHNLAEAIAVAEAAKPCILWIDEIEKAFAGAKGSNGANSDITVRRMIGSFLTWLQERKSEVFVAATANSIDGLPPELMRKGRLDETFYLTYPTDVERKQMFSFCLKKYGFTNLDDNALSKLAGKTNYFSGAEIEAVVLVAVEEYFILKELDHKVPDIMVELNIAIEKIPRNDSERKKEKEGLLEEAKKKNWMPASR